MNAVISGTAGRALLIEGNSLKSFDVDDPSKLVDRQQSELPYLFGEGRDLRIIENSDIESIAAELESDSNSALALDLTLISFDEDLEADIREDALKDLDELLVEDQLVVRLENILYARPLPDDGDLVGALTLCADAQLPNILSFLQRLGKHQSVIAEVSATWDIIPTKVFGSHDNQVEFQHVAVREGLFRALVIALAQAHTTRGANLQTDVQGKLSKFFLDAGLNPSIKSLRNHRQVLQDWIDSFRRRSDARPIKHEIEEEERETAPRRRRGRRVGVDRQAVLREVNRQKAIISAAIQRRDLGIVHELLQSLVNYQLRSGEAKHLAKSLCDLAIEAKTLGLLSLRLELTERSISIAPDDYWSWAQYGDALLSLQRFDDALEAYQQSENFGAGGLARTGTGEALKAKGELEGALAAYDEVIWQHPEDVVAKAGRAEVLKAQGEFKEALAAYDEVIRQHPESVVPKNGRAEVLKAQGEFKEALAAYDEISREHPENVVAKNGRAEVLKAQGQFKEALAAFDEVIRQHPENAIAKNGRAEVLKAEGQFKDALAAFDGVIREHPENVVAKSGRAEVLKASKQLHAALAAYDEIRSRFPSSAIARNGRSCVLADLHRYDEALEDLPADKPVSLDDWIGFHIRGMVLMRMKRIEEAIQIFQRGVNENPFPSTSAYFQAGLAVALIRQEKYADAKNVLSDIDAPNLKPQIDVLRLHASGEEKEFDEANAAFEDLTPKPWSISDELLDELHRRYILKVPATQSDDWVFDKEVESLLLVANQQTSVSSYAQ